MSLVDCISFERADLATVQLRPQLCYVSFSMHNIKTAPCFQNPFSKLYMIDSSNSLSKLGCAKYLLNSLALRVQRNDGEIVQLSCLKLTATRRAQHTALLPSCKQCRFMPISIEQCCLLIASRPETLIARWVRGPNYPEGPTYTIIAHGIASTASPAVITTSGPSPYS